MKHNPAKERRLKTILHIAVALSISSITLMKIVLLLTELFRG